MADPVPDCSSIKTLLDSANAAYARLLTGANIVTVVDSFRSRVEYTAANRQALFAYIQRLQVQYDHCMGCGQPQQWDAHGQPKYPFGRGPNEPGRHAVSKPLNFVF